MFPARGQLNLDGFCPKDLVFLRLQFSPFGRGALLAVVEEN